MRSERTPHEVGHPGRRVRGNTEEQPETVGLRESEAQHVLDAAADLLAVELDGGAADRDQIQTFSRHRCPAPAALVPPRDRPEITAAGAK